MAIRPEERSQNVTATLFNYVKDNYNTTPIQYSGVQFDEQNHNEWIRLDVMIPTSDYFRQVDTGLYGANLIVILSANVLVKGDKVLTENAYRREQIVDELKHLFRVPKQIPVYDHFTGPPLADIGTLSTYDVDEVDLGYNTEAALFQNNVSSVMFFLSKWEAP